MSIRIVNLIENTPGVEGCGFEHGLSFYIETEKHKILMDMGASEQILENAKMLGISLKNVDLAVLSHGHYDHSGGLLGFARINAKAPIYMQKTALEGHYHIEPGIEKYIGIDPEIAKLSQIQWLEGNMDLDEEISLFTGITGRKYFSAGNRILQVKTSEGYQEDSFDHEQCMVIRQDGKQYLFSGCAHNGIVNVLERYRSLYGSDPDVVITGFHLMKKTEYTQEEIENIRQLAAELKETKILFYSGHCTGPQAYGWMKEILGEQLQELHTGMEIKE